MYFRSLEHHFNRHQLITIQEIRNAFGKYDRRQISEWASKGWLIRLRQGQYILTSKKEQIDKELLSNEMKNSYISLEYALNHYNFIPEIPHQITSVTTQRNETVKTPFGNFIYRHIKPSLYTGYQLKTAQLPNRKIKIASPTKALFDFIYLNGISTLRDFQELRLNYDQLSTFFSQKDFLNWQNMVTNPAINNRLQNFLSFVKKHAIFRSN